MSEDEKKQLEERVIMTLKTIYDPEIPVDIYELGLIYDVVVNDDASLYIKMTLTSPGCPAAGYLVEQIRKRMEEHPQVKECKVELVWDPKWDPKTMASDEAKEELGIW